MSAEFWESFLAEVRRRSSVGEALPPLPNPMPPAPQYVMNYLETVYPLGSFLATNQLPSQPQNPYPREPPSTYTPRYDFGIGAPSASSALTPRQARFARFSQEFNKEFEKALKQPLNQHPREPPSTYSPRERERFRRFERFSTEYMKEFHKQLNPPPPYPSPPPFPSPPPYPSPSSYGSVPGYTTPPYHTMPRSPQRESFNPPTRIPSLSDFDRDELRGIYHPYPARISCYTPPPAPLGRAPRQRSLSMPEVPIQEFSRPTPIPSLSRMEEPMEVDENIDEQNQPLPYISSYTPPPLPLGRTPPRQRSLSVDAMSNQFDHIDANGRNLAVRLCKAFRRLRLANWHELCRLAFVRPPFEEEEFSQCSRILTWYITQVQAFQILFQNPQFLEHLNCLHMNTNLVETVLNELDLAAEPFENANWNHRFSFISDSEGLYGPNAQTMHRELDPRGTVLEKPINGMFTLLQKMRLFLSYQQRGNRERTFPDICEFMEGTVREAIRDHNSYNELMGERFESPQVEGATASTPKSILKRRGTPQRPRSIQFGGAATRSVWFDPFGDGGDIFNDDTEYRTVEEFATRKHEYYRNLQNLKDLGYKIPNIRVKRKGRKLVEKKGYIMDITGKYDHPSTVILESPESSDDETNASNFADFCFDPTLVFNWQRKRKFPQSKKTYFRKRNRS